MKKNIKTTVVILTALFLGLGLAWLDSRPGWDATGISAFVLLFGSLFLTALAPKYFWLIAPCIGIWIPLYGILHGNPSASIAFIPAVVGSLIGGAIRTGANSTTSKQIR